MSAASSRVVRPAVLRDAVLGSLLTAVALVGFESSFGGQRYLVVGLVGVVVGVAIVSSVGRRLPAVAVVAALLAAHVVVGGAIALSDRAFIGLVPSPDTVTGALDAIVAGWKQLLTTVPPVGRLGNLMALPFFCGVMGAGLSLHLAASSERVPLALLPPLGVLVFALFAGVEEPVSVVLHGGVFAFLAIGWMSLRYRSGSAVVEMVNDDRRRRDGAAVAFLALVTAAGLLTADVLPLAHAADRALLREVIEPPFDPREYPSPLSAYRYWIGPLETTPLFTVEVLDGELGDVPIRMATLDQYDGVVWHMQTADNVRRGSSGYFERMGTTMPPEFDGERATVRVTIENWNDVWLPTIGEVVDIRFEGTDAQALEAAYRYSAGTDTAAMQGRRLRGGDSYVMEIVVPRAVPEGGSATVLSRPAALDTSLAPSELAEWAAGVVDEVADPWRRFAALVEETRSQYYSDGNLDTVPPQAPTPGGHSSSRLADFAVGSAAASDVPGGYRFGNAEQYAAALGLMARSLDIPARVVVGFEPDWGSGPVTVRGYEAEAWVEVPTREYGWSFAHPTPDRTRTSPRELPQVRPPTEQNTQVPMPPPVRVDDPVSQGAKETEEQKNVEPPSLGRSTTIPTVVVVVGLSVLVPLLVVGVPIVLVLWMKARRRRRRRSEGSPSHRVANGFREVLDTVADLGETVPRHATRRELVSVIGTPGAADLAASADRFVFSPETIGDVEVEHFWSQVDGTIGDLHHRVGRLSRWRSRVSVRSLRRRARR